MFDALIKRYIRATVALCVVCIVLGATSFTMTMFYLSTYKKHVLFNVLVRDVKLTAYRSVRSQTDSSPFITSIGHRTHPFGCAVSQDLLSSGQVKYGDVIYIPYLGFRMVNDTMNKRITNSIDLWVSTKDDEKKIGIRQVTIMILRVNRD